MDEKSPTSVVTEGNRVSEVVLKPGVVVEVQAYDDDQIAQWDADDNLQEREHKRILDAVTTSK